MDINQRLTEELDVKRWQIDAAVQLIDEGNTIPFISRYRKEATGELNDEQLRKLYERLVYLRNLEEKKEQVKNFRPIDDTFFEVLADDIGVCQEMLRIILEDEKLIVKDVIVQSSKRNLYGRSVRLDALCILENGKKCNVEVQRSNKDHHLKRVRFNASVITVRDSQTDDKFEETIDLIVVYISEFDIFKRGRVIYHVDSVIRETQEKVDDGLERVFVNTAVKDGTTISEYMNCFLQKEIDNAKFPELTNRVHYLKHEEGGVNAVCEVMRKYSEEVAEKAYLQGEEAGKEIGQRHTAIAELQAKAK